jgi:predicted nucleotidyltransferase
MLNAAVSTEEAAASAPTLFPELNELLAELVARVESILGDNFVGAYLVGGFALGGGDLQSDCDFLVVTEEQVTAEQERQLRELHDEIPTRPGHWPHDLEGSYAPRADLETLAALDRQWLYVNRGGRDLEWSTHCNTEDVRWTLRERGITLAGPEPRPLVAEVPADVLRSRMPALIDSFLPDLLSWTSFDIGWAQRYAVTTLCRMLYTLERGEVPSKPASLEWAKSALPTKWHGLIQQASDDRPLPWSDPPRPGSVEATIAFSEYAKERAADSSSARHDGDGA